MKTAMILAAGFGKRMGSLTCNTPKPLLCIGGKPLIFYHLERLAHAGFERVVINVSYLREQIMAACGSGEQFGLTIDYSVEQSPLETSAGIAHARDLLGDAPFLLVNADVFTDYPFEHMALSLDTAMAHLVMVPNPPEKQTGDFALLNQTVVCLDDSVETDGYTYAGIAILHPELFVGQLYRGPKLRDLFEHLISQALIIGSKYEGLWMDVGTPERLEQANQQLNKAYG